MWDHLAFEPYGWFIWSAYAVFAIVIGGLAVQTWASSRATRRRLRRLEEGAAERRPR